MCLQLFADLRCVEMRGTLAGNKIWRVCGGGGVGGLAFHHFHQIRGGNEYGCPQARGEGNSGADEVPEGCMWTVPELFSWVAAREHVDRPRTEETRANTEEALGCRDTHTCAELRTGLGNAMPPKNSLHKKYTSWCMLTVRTRGKLVEGSHL